jgi:hypothetical protein
VRDVDDLPADIHSGALQAADLHLDTLRMSVKNGHACPIGGKRLGISEPDPAGPAGNDNSIAFDTKKILNLHSPHLRR